MNKGNYCVEIDGRPELWDKHVSKNILDMIDYDKTHYNREGECNRCGKCCYWVARDGSLKPCKHLNYDDEGLAICDLHGKPERPNRCINFPEKRDTLNKFQNCGFNWVEK